MDKEQELSRNEVKLKAANFCAYQERSQKEVRNKLYDLGLYRDDVEEILTELILEGFINEERFAKAYCGGKFRVKKWGKQKILQGLKQHDISRYCCEKGLEEIEDAEYHEMLEELIVKKEAQVKADNLYAKRHKVATYVISKGFEPDMVWPLVKDKIS